MDRSFDDLVPLTIIGQGGIVIVRGGVCVIHLGRRHGNKLRRSSDKFRPRYLTVRQSQQDG
jgi:hypothetical protein